MRKNYLDEFDREVRTLMEAAELELSRDVWEGISARLDAGAAESAAAGSRPVWYRWAAPALAFACVAVGAFLIWSRPRESAVERLSSPILADSRSRIETEYAGPQVSFDEYVSGGMLPMGVSDDALRMLGSAVAEAAPSGLLPRSVWPDAGSGEDIPDSSSLSLDRSDRKVIAEVDPFAILQADDLRARKKPNSPSVYAKGAVGGNNSDGFLRKTAMMSPGTSGAGNTGITELSESSYGVPFTLGLGVRVYFMPRVSVGTGIDYSLLTRTFTGEYMDEAGTFLHTLQYIGVPLNIYYDVISSERIKFYVHAGGEVEKCISNRYTFYSSPDVTLSEPVRKLQYSVGAGLGVEFTLTDRLGLYVDPGFQYYFFCSQPKSVRTQRPLFVNFDLGLRFNF